MPLQAGPCPGARCCMPVAHGPQPMAEASVETICLDTCTRGTPAQREARSEQGLKVWRQNGVTGNREVPHCPTHLGTRS